MATHLVTALQLNLRSAPDPTKNNKIVVLAQGTPVKKIADSPTPNWWEIEATIAGQTIRGFVNSSFLGPLSTPFPGASAVGGLLPIADLGTSPSAKRTHAGSWARGIGEAGRPAKVSSHPGGIAAGILETINWLNVESTSHGRWKPAGGNTYCNIYVYDVCNIAGCYVPRVWWTPRAISALQSGQTVAAKYGDTVTELAANYIFNWLEQFGSSYGWSRLFDIDKLQTEVNSGKLGIICAQRTQMNKPGHIQIIAPEHGQTRAKRSNGRVTQPLQSNAGSRNFNYGFLNNNWWAARNFREFGFWTAIPA